MTAICAHQTVGVDVRRTEWSTSQLVGKSPVALLNDLGGRLPSDPLPSDYKRGPEARSSSNVFDSLRSTVSKPSVNQP